MTVSLEGFPGTGKSTVVKKLGDLGFDYTEEHFEFLESIPPVPRTSEEKKQNHREFLELEKRRHDDDDVSLVDRSFVSSIVFNKMLGEDGISRIKSDYEELVDDKSIIMPDKAVILRRPEEEIVETLRERDEMNEFWLDPDAIPRYYKLLKEELRAWDIPYTVVDNDGSVDSLVDQVREEIPAKLTVFVLSYNALNYLEKTLRSIERRINLPYELLIIDNNSKKAVQEYLDEYTPRSGTVVGHQIIFNDHNRGFAGGCNQGLREIDTEYFALLNNDVELMSSSLQPVIRLLEDGAALVGPQTNKISESAPSFDQLLDRSGEKRTDLILGHCMFGNTRNVRDVGGFDESFRIGNFEDIDLCLRLSEAQETLCVCYDYEVFHHGHKSFKDSEQSLDTCLEKNRQRFIEKWDCEGKELLRKYGL